MSIGIAVTPLLTHILWDQHIQLADGFNDRVCEQRDLNRYARLIQDGNRSLDPSEEIVSCCGVYDRPPFSLS